MRISVLAAAVSWGLVSAGFAADDLPVDPARLRALAPAIEAKMAAGRSGLGIPGIAVALVNRAGVVWSSGLGVTRVGAEAAVGSHTVFEIGSTTKAFLAATLALAVDAGELAWDDRVADRLPGFRLADPWITRELRVADLLRQCSGLKAYGLDFAWGTGATDAEAILRALLDAPIDPGGFRRDFQYVNSLHIVTGLLLAQRAGLPDWEVVVRRRLLGPLGMEASVLRSADFEAIADRAQPHALVSGKPVPVAPIPDVSAGAGVIKSSVADMAKWLQFQLARGVVGTTRLLAEAHLIQTRTPFCGPTPEARYAMGWGVVRTPNGSFVYHNGGTTGSNAHVAFLEGRDFGVVILTNLQPRGFADALGFWILDRVLGNPDQGQVEETIAAAAAAPPSAPPRTPFTRLPSAYEGTYDSPLVGRITVTAAGDGLRATFARSPARLLLDPIDGDRFLVRLVAPWLPEMPLAADDLPARFETGADGTAARLRLLDPANPLLFTRVN